MHGLRAVAATMVFAFHAWGHSGYPSTTVLLPGLGAVQSSTMFQFGAHGVALFFALSGFLLSIPFWQSIVAVGVPKPDLRRYFGRRLLRIYPAYLVAICVFALLYDIDHSPLVRFVHVITHLALVHNFMEVTVGNLSTPLWSVATEFQMYVILPVMFVVAEWFSRRGATPKVLSLAMLLVGGASVLLFTWSAQLVMRSVQVNPKIVASDGMVLLSSPFVGLGAFAGGMAFGCLYLLWREHDGLRTTRMKAVVEASSVLVVVLLLLLAAKPDMFGDRLRPWPLPQLLFAALVLLVGLSRSRVGLARLLEWRPIWYVGLVSYSFYLYHDYVLWNTFNRLLPGAVPWLPQFDIVKAMVAYTLTLALAWVSYEIVERRVTGKIRAAWYRRSPGAVSPPALAPH